jgi:hypothetical protein
LFFVPKVKSSLPGESSFEGRWYLKMITNKDWITTKLMNFGNVNKITKDIPTKQFGSDDGAIWAGQGVGWSS